MGISTDLMQQLNRTFVSQKAEKDFYRKKKTELKNYLYNRFYKKFAENEEKPPENTFGYFLQTDIQKKILEKFNELDITTRIEIYNSVLKKVYNQFKNDFKLNYSYENIEKEEAKQQKEQQKEYNRLLKIYERNEKTLAKQNRQLKQLKRQQLHYAHKCIKNTSKGIKQIGLGLFIGGRVADKTYKKMKY